MNKQVNKFRRLFTSFSLLVFTYNLRPERRIKISTALFSLSMHFSIIVIKCNNHNFQWGHLSKRQHLQRRIWRIINASLRKNENRENEVEKPDWSFNWFLNGLFYDSLSVVKSQALYMCGGDSANKFSPPANLFPYMFFALRSYWIRFLAPCALLHSMKFYTRKFLNRNEARFIWQVGKIYYHLCGHK